MTHKPVPEPLKDAQLNTAFATLRGELAPQLAPRRVEDALMAAFARQHAPRHWFKRARWAWAGALGTGCAAALLAVLMLPVPVPPGAPTLAGAPLDAGAFVALESLERIAQEAAPSVITTALPRTELAALGVALSPENAGDAVLADILVGADGAPLALRLSLH